MNRCKICDRVPATEEQFRNTAEGEGEHLCWGQWSARQCQAEAVDWHEKHQELRTNFVNLDKYNDVLYLVYHLARRLRNNGFNHDTLAELYGAVSNVERFENDLYTNRKAEHRPSKENEDRRHMDRQIW